jgi:hypothetical protein
MTHRILTASTLAFALVLTACDSDDEETTTTAATSDTDAGTGTTGTTGTGTTGTGTTGTGTTGTTDEPTTGTTDATTGGEMAGIRVIHLSPDAPAVDVFVNGGADAVVSDLAVLNSTDYLMVPAGTYTFDIAPAGAGLAASVIQVADLPLEAGVNYSAIAVGKLSPNAGDGEFTVLAIVDEAPVDPANVNIQVLHAAAAAPFAQVDVWEVSDAANPVLLIEDFNFGEGAALEIPPSALEIGLDIDNDLLPDATFSVPDALTAGTTATVAAYSNAADAPSLEAVLAAGPTVSIPAN